MPSTNDDSYFNPRNKHRVVEDFVVTFLQPKGIRVVTKKLLEDATATKGGLREQSYRQQVISSLRLRGQRFYPYEEDERFSNLRPIAKKYTATDLKKAERRILEDKLYDLITTLMLERRIEGDFKLQPYRDWEMNRVLNRLNELEKRQRSRRGLGIPP